MFVIALPRAHRVHLVALMLVALTAVFAVVTATTASAGTPGGGGQPGATGGYASGGWGGCFFGTCDSNSNAGGGGGASSVQTCSAGDADCVAAFYTGTEPRLVVAGGGGGAGGYDGCGGGSAGGGRQGSNGGCDNTSGGGGGNGTGGSGESVSCVPEGAAGGGASPTAAGTAGTGGGGQEDGTAGSGPVGGDGYLTTASSGGGGGGGGGYYGGGGGGATGNCGAWGAGGGAGSSYSASAMTVGNDTTGTPQITFTYNAGSTTKSFSTGPEQTWVVPVGVTTLHVVAVGGTGGNNGENDGFGGQGAVVTTDISVTPGSTLYVDVASNGSNATVAPGAAATSVSAISGSASYGGPATLTATLQSAGSALSGKSVDFTLDGSSVGSATTDANGIATLTGVSIGSRTPATYTATVVASFTGGGSYDGSTGSGDLTVTQAAQTVTFTSSAPSSATVGGTYSATATGGGSGNAVTFSRDSGTTGSACTVAADGSVTFDHVGTCVVDADQAGDANYTAAPQAQQQIAVGPAAQTISFTSTAPSAAVVGDAYTVTATGGGSGNPVSFTADATTTNNACSVATSGAVTLDHAGTCVIDADQAGNTDYTAAPQAQQQVAVGPAAQAINFTSTAPSSPVVGDSYAVTATGGASGNAVTFTADAATTNNACTVSSAGAVTFDHAGTCVVDADQAGNTDYTAAPTAQQQIEVAPAAQVVGFTSTAPAAPAYGDTYNPTATGGGSGNPIVYSIDATTTHAACSVTSGTVTFNHAGTCVVDADQAGTADYTAAPAVSQTVDVAPAAQAITFTSVLPAHAVVGDSYTPAATGGGSGNAVTFSTDPATTNNACSISAGTLTFDHAGICVVDGDQAGNADYTAAPTAMQNIPVGAAATTTSVSVQPATISAIVTAAGTTPTGLVEFTVDGSTVGTAPVGHDGHASLSYVVPADATRHVAAIYQGDADFTGSVASTTRSNPTIHATVTSARPQSAHGWYSTPVTVSFGCDPGSAQLSQPCPAPVTMSAIAGGQSVQRFVTTDDGGAAAVAVTGINIDRTRPAVRIVGVRNGAVYRGAPLLPRCAGSDPESGIVACTLRMTTSRDGVVRYRATAVNAAGLWTATRGSYRMLTIWVARASFGHDHFQVGAANRYVIYAAAKLRPRYEWAAPTNTAHPADRPRGGGTAFVPAGAGLWRTMVTFTPSMLKHYRLWNLGVRIGSTTKVLTVRLHR